MYKPGSAFYQSSQQGFGVATLDGPGTAVAWDGDIIWVLFGNRISQNPMINKHVPIKNIKIVIWGIPVYPCIPHFQTHPFDIADWDCLSMLRDECDDVVQV